MKRSDMKPLAQRLAQLPHVAEQAQAVAVMECPVERTEEDVTLCRQDFDCLVLAALVGLEAIGHPEPSPGVYAAVAASQLRKEERCQAAWGDAREMLV